MSQETDADVAGVVVLVSEDNDVTVVGSDDVLDDHTDDVVDSVPLTQVVVWVFFDGNFFATTSHSKTHIKIE